MSKEQKTKIKQHLVAIHAILGNTIMNRNTKLQHIVLVTEQLFGYELGIQVADIIDRSGIMEHLNLTVSDVLDTLLANSKRVA